MTKDRLLTTQQVADRLGLDGRAGQRQVVRMIEAELLPAQNISTGSKRPRWRVPESALVQWLAANAPKPDGAQQENRSTSNFLRQERRERRRAG